MLRHLSVSACVTLLFLQCAPFPADAEELLIPPGSQQVYTHAKPIGRVAVGDPAVAGVSVTAPDSLLITGKAVGATSLFVWDKGNAAAPAWQTRVLVAPPLEHADDTARLAPLAGTRLKLSGELSSLDRHQAVLKSIPDKDALVDASASNFDSQVQIDIKVVEVSQRRLMDAGFFLGKNSGSRVTAISGPGVLSGVQSKTASEGFSLVSESGFLPFRQAFNLVSGNSRSGLLGILSLLENDGFAYTLAEPSLAAISGQTATFLAGGEFPIPMQSGGGSDSSIRIQFKEFGIKLALTPTVLAQDRIFLKVSPEVSELDGTMGIQTGGVAVPGLRVRRTDTSVALADGESFILSGLTSRSTTDQVDKFPFLGDIPILGAFFRSTRFDRTDKELLMVVTAHVVRPFAKGQPLPPLPGEAYRNYDPTFLELMFRTGRPAGSATGFSE